MIVRDTSESCRKELGKFEGFSQWNSSGISVSTGIQWNSTRHFYGESKINHRKEREDRKTAEERKSTETEEKKKREFGHEDNKNNRRPQTTLGRTYTKNRMEDRSSRD